MNTTKLQYDVAAQLTKALRNHVNMINKQLDFIERNEHKIAQLDLDIMTDRIRKMYDAVCVYPVVLNQQTDIPAFNAESSIAPARKEEVAEPVVDKLSVPVSDENVPDSARNDEGEAAPKEIQQTNKESGQTNSNSTIEIPAPAQEVAHHTSRSVSQSRLVEQQRTTIDLFGQSNPERVADKLVKEQDDSVAAKMQRQPISDLKMAIGINEKFLFVNELFGGSLEKYNLTIDELNSFKSFNGAKTFLIEKKVHQQWNDDSPAFMKMMNLVERKFDANE